MNIHTTWKSHHYVQSQKACVQETQDKTRYQEGAQQSFCNFMLDQSQIYWGFIHTFERLYSINKNINNKQCVITFDSPLV